MSTINIRTDIGYAEVTIDNLEAGDGLIVGVGETPAEAIEDAVTDLSAALADLMLMREQRVTV